LNLIFVIDFVIAIEIVIEFDIVIDIAFLPQIIVETPQFLKLFFLAKAKRPTEALAIA
jgi:hypothetical protein